MRSVPAETSDEYVCRPCGRSVRITESNPKVVALEKRVKQLEVDVAMAAHFISELQK